MPARKAIWKNDTQFNTGPPTLVDTEVVGIGDPAYVQLKAGTGQGDVDFEIPGQYIYDPTKIEVAGGKAILKNTGGSLQNYPFDIPADYTYDTSLIKVVGGKASLVDQMIPYVWYHLNESAGSVATDASGNGRNGTLMNMEDADWVTGMPNLHNCLTFDGVNEYVKCGNIANFNRFDMFSAECWFKTSKVGGQSLISKCETAGTYRGWELSINYPAARNILFMLCNSQGPSNYICVKSNTLYTYGIWNHVVVTYNGSGLASGVHIYLNGVDTPLTVLADTLTDTTQTTLELNIASRQGTNLFLGNIDEPIVYTSVLTLAQVLYRYNTGNGIETVLHCSTLAPDIVNNTGLVFALPLNVFTETAVKPATTGIQYQVSSDNGATWKWWNGAAWVARTPGQTNLWYYNNESNSAAVVTTKIASLALAGTFKFKAFLSTTLDTTSPELENLLVGSVVFPIGDWVVTANFDIQPAAVADWTASIETVIKDTVAGTDIKYQYSTDSGGTWNGAWLTNAQLTTAIQGIPCGGSGADKLRIKFQLSTTDTMLTPEISNLRITYNTGYALTGTYTSVKYVPAPSATNGIYVGPITFNATLPAGTSVVMRARTVDDVLEDNYSKPWTAYLSGETIGICGQFIQFEATLATASSLMTPRLNGVEVEFHLLIGIQQIMDATVVAIKAQTDEILDLFENKLTINATTSELCLWNDAGTVIIKKWPISDKDGNPVVLTNHGPVNRGKRVL